MPLLKLGDACMRSKRAPVGLEPSAENACVLSCTAAHKGPVAAAARKAAEVKTVRRCMVLRSQPTKICSPYFTVSRSSKAAGKRNLHGLSKNRVLKCLRSFCLQCQTDQADSLIGHVERNVEYVAVQAQIVQRKANAQWRLFGKLLLIFSKASRFDTSMTSQNS